MKTRHILNAADTTDNSARSASDLGPRHLRMQQSSKRKGATICTIRFSFGIARVLDHSLWYADKLIVQLNGCASSRP